MIAQQQGYLSSNQLLEIQEVVVPIFKSLDWKQLDVSLLFKYLNQDKKNQDQQWRYVALESAGVYHIDAVMNPQELEAALLSLQSME
jgi:3-dehydroquinate synthetase